MWCIARAGCTFRMSSWPSPVLSFSENVSSSSIASSPWPVTALTKPYNLGTSGWLDARGLAGRAQVQLDGWKCRMPSDAENQDSATAEVLDLDPLLQEVRSRCSNWVDNRAEQSNDTSHYVPTFAVGSRLLWIFATYSPNVGCLVTSEIG